MEQVASPRPTTAAVAPPPRRHHLRRLDRLPADLARRYTAAVAALAPVVESALGPEVVANRTVAADPGPPRLELEPWMSARRRFQARARRLAARSGALLAVDVRACYASIRPDAVERALRRLGCPPGPVEDVRGILRAVRERGVPGLPVGPPPSAVLANAVLGPVDGLLVGAGARHLRWVDDFWVFAPDASTALGTLCALERELGELGLRLAPEKTRLVTGSEALRRTAGWPGPSGPGPRYHRPSDAHPVPGVPGPHAVPSAGRGVDLGGRPARGAPGLG